MKAKEIIEAMGGLPYVRSLTGVTRSMVYLMISSESIASHHIRLFIAIRPELDWPNLLEADIAEYTDLLADKSLRDVRNSRRRKRGNTDAVAELQ